MQKADAPDFSVAFKTLRATATKTSTATAGTTVVILSPEKVGVEQMHSKSTILIAPRVQ